MKKNIITLLIITLIISSCSSYKNLSSNHSDEKWEAKFENFNGSEKLEFTKQKDTILYFVSQLKTKKGDLSLKINSNNFLNNKSINHTKVKLNKRANIKITGNNANGSFKLYYPKYEKKEIQVKYNSNIELLVLCFLLDSYEDYLKIPENQSFNINGKEVRIKELLSMSFKIINEFKKYSNSKNLKIIQSYFKKDFYLHYANFVLSLQPFPNAVVNKNNNFINKFKDIKDANNFVSALNSFHNEIKFDSFLNKYKVYYDTMINEVKQNMPRENFIVEMEHFFKKEINNYILYPSLTMAFGQAFGVGSNNTIGNIFASFEAPKEINNTSKLKLGFNNNASLRNICVHEFGHSFINQAVNKVDDNIIKSKEYLFKPIKNKMTEQGYNQWKISLYEHFVRANEVIIAKLLGNKNEADKILKDNVKDRSFTYLPQIIEKLEFWYYKEYLDMSYEEKVREIIKELK